MKQKMLLVARYNFAYNLPALIDYDEELLNSAGLSYGHHTIIDHWAEKSRIIKVYSNPKKEYYKEAIKRNRVSNYEYMLEYLGSLPNKKNETEEWTFKELNERFKEQCKHTQDNINSSQSENDEKYPWITQLREEHYLWDEQTAKKAITIIEENNIAYKAALSKKGEKR